MKNLNLAQQFFCLMVAFAFLVLGYFAGVHNATKLPPNTDINRDGKVNIEDFSIALYLVENIQKEMRNFHQPENVIEDVYPPVPLPYQPNN